MPDPLRRCLPVSLLIVSLGAPALAASPRDELLRHVPGDVAFCLSVQDLRGQAARFGESPLAETLAKALAKANPKQFEQIGEFEKYLEKHLGVGLKGIRDDLLGDAFVFAYKPGPADKPEQEQGMFLLRARDGKKLAAFVAKLNALQKESGELKEVSEREHKGVKYHRRVERETNYYLLRDGVLVFSGQESMLKAAIERDQALAKDAEPPLAKRLAELGIEKAFVSLLIQPRAFDAMLAGKQDAASKTVAACWKALDGLGMTLDVGKEVQLSLVMKGKADKLPASWRKLLAGAKTSELWSAFPDDALFATAGQLDVSALYQAVGELMPKSTKEATDTELERTLGAMLGKGVVKQVLPALGPDWGVCVTAPPKVAKDWIPRAIAAVKVARGDEDAPVDDAILSGLETWAQLMVVTHNKANPERTLTLETTRIDRVKARYLGGDGLPGGVKPAFGMRGRYLVLSSSLDGLKAFQTSKVSDSDTVPLMRMSVKRLREYLSERREPLADALAAHEKLTKEQAGARLDEAVAGLGLIDTVELRRKSQGERATFTLALRPAKAMRK